MTLPVTLTILAASVALAGVLVWLERRPPEPGRIRYLPTTPLLFAAILIAILMIVHLVTLGGGVTGR
ncbi:MAG: hypothetical protein K9G30_05420 [Parvibaculum sp.]|nr:hypothetical protein [Parvibaculum sp.]